MTQALLDISGLPKFSKIKIKDIESSIDKVIKNNQEQLASLLEKGENLDWETLNQTLEQMDNILSRVWSPVSHMNSVVNSDELRKVHDLCVPKLSSYSTEQSQNSALYKAINSIKDSDSFDKLDQANKKVIENSLLQFQLNGVALADNEKQKFKEIKQNLSTLKSKFEQNIMDATQAFRIHIEEQSELDGLPDFVKDMAKQAAREEDLKGWLFTLDAPSYIAVMTYSDIRKFRQEMYNAFTTRASKKGPNADEFDNSEVMEDILKSRKELADILGYRNYAEISIANKMAESTDDVIGFLTNLVNKSKPQADAEFETLKSFAKNYCDIRKSVV